MAPATDDPGLALERYRGYLRVLARLQIAGRLRAKLDPSDQPHVTDFGLAKRFAGRSASAGPAALPLTSSGAAVGTPAYMAPEQASGASSGLTTAVDVYALGAILYELLTGRPPFRGATPLETVLAVLADEPVPPRQLNPGLPRDLETVCLKCLRKEPGQRYASAAALADDLERFLAGDTVQARRVGRLERLGRWCRRNPVPALSAALTAAALVAVAVVCGLYALAESRHATRLAALQQQAEQAAVEARHQAQLADEQRAQAEDAFRQAHQAVNDCVQASEALARHPGLQPLCKDLLTAALRYYRFQQALAINRKLMDLDPSVTAYRREVAKNHALCGDVLSANRQLADAVAAYGRARALQEEVVRGAPRDAGAREELAHTLNNLGLTLARLARYDDALAALRGAVEQARAAAEQAPQVQEYRRVWATCCGALAEAARAAGRPEDSGAALLDRRRLCADNPQELYRVARELALTAAAVGRGQADLPAAEAARRDRWAAEAVATLQQAVAQGYRDAGRLRQDSALQALRGRGDFEDLLIRAGGQNR